MLDMGVSYELSVTASCLKTHILERPHLFHRVALYDGLPRCQVFGLVPEASGVVHHYVAQGRIAPFRLVADGVFFTDVFSLMTMEDIISEKQKVKSEKWKVKSQKLKVKS